MNTIAHSQHSTTYRDALITARELSPDALLAIDDAQAAIEADPDPCFPGDVGRFNASERRRAIHTVLDQRDRLVAHDPTLKRWDDAQYAAWRDLARVVRERVEVPRIFDEASYQLQRAGHNGRRGVDEWAGACPLCGGMDRLRVWAGPNGRAWCRQCGWSADVVTVTQSLIPGCQHFRDAVRWLAELAGAGAVSR